MRTLITATALVTACVTFLFLLIDFLGYKPYENALLCSALLLFPILLIFTHASWLFSTRNAILFLLVSLLYGFVIEQAGLHLGAFGGSYQYDPRFPAIAGVPYLIPLYWFVFLYLGFTLHKSPFLGALAVLSIDIASDPLHVLVGNWHWITPGHYFSVPLGNFLGWFIFSYIFLKTTKFFVLQLPEKNREPAHIVPFVFYLSLAFLFGWAGFRLGVLHYPVPGIILMLIFAYLHWREARSKRIIIS